MESYNWPGNIRQIENFVERLTVTFKNQVVTPEDLPDEFHPKEQQAMKYSGNSLAEMMEEFEKNILIDAFKKYRTSIAVGKALHISQTTAARKLRKYIPGYVEKRLEERQTEYD